VGTYAALIRKAVRSIPAELRTDVTFERRTQGASDPTTGLPGAPIITTITGVGIGSAGDVDEYLALGLVQSSARTIEFIPDAGQSETLPLEGDTIAWAGAAYTVKAAYPTQPGGATLAARVVLSR
jgi:hypothetical protein